MSSTTDEVHSPRLNQHKSLLLCLPPELRNKIYEYTFAGHEISVERAPAEAQPSFRYRPLSGRQAAWSPVPFRFGLQGACRQLRRETAHYRDLFYSLNAFHGLVDDITAFLQNPAIKKDRITVLHIDASTLVIEESA
ncbi:hypothetical protein EJ07DRAFT_177260 [Lizonia empirigonia]|nr:hypothetical protein EJ07DRAFT_177260 [Lizonia empirigonia]